MSQSNLKILLESRIQCCNKDIETLTLYMRNKIEARDWHAVSDAANDIREIESVLLFAKELLDFVTKNDNTSFSQGIRNSL